ncbi:Co2+/Mg2+ efflux protein ApaG [Vineibacter terrae]|uniref:Protein ApaG n=1 Tax=Vineibacter terrae TaxID=2586908 RepID=A0A5C8PKF0_9HYPH|nr:Co2+/Mg2+ efflux protein ApaG [Vineibacter terrae]TXL74145.1 Co2+/Mg2+ efflux protein ApaG [Vineibacter terrae]
MFSEETRAIRVTVAPTYLQDQSDPDEARWVWAYTVRIENRGTEKVQLVSRHWMITNSRGRQEEVRGPGVVGKTPMIEPGKSFEYTSGCPLDTPSGFMAGTYQMVAESGERFDIRIPTFSLDLPREHRSTLSQEHRTLN